MAEPIELGTDECALLLRSGVVGRIALSTPTGPHIVPVNYSVVDDAIVFRTTPYSVLGTHGRNALLAFEIDHFDYEYWTGWSVMARGRAEAVHDATELERIKQVWQPRPWASGQRNLYFALHWTELTGRRLGARSAGSSANAPVERRSG
ncbi:pyridoxamine 5'-phosphate oxidase family protein [Methylocystis sp.]|uniref:pyridoxamine 5'-phosphate oxidase family protein n=1 Tax=Methylocystis sp. TaxID=1911079 RepID=UPI003DA5A878